MIEGDRAQSYLWQAANCRAQDRSAVALIGIGWALLAIAKSMDEARAALAEDDRGE